MSSHVTAFDPSFHSQLSLTITVCPWNGLREAYEKLKISQIQQGLNFETDYFYEQIKVKFFHAAVFKPNQVKKKKIYETLG